MQVHQDLRGDPEWLGVHYAILIINKHDGFAPPTCVGFTWVLKGKHLHTRRKVIKSKAVNHLGNQITQDTGQSNDPLLLKTRSIPTARLFWFPDSQSQSLQKQTFSLLKLLLLETALCLSTEFLPLEDKKWVITIQLVTLTTWRPWTHSPQAYWSPRIDNINPCDSPYYLITNQPKNCVWADHIPWDSPLLPGLWKCFPESHQRVLAFWALDVLNSLNCILQETLYFPWIDWLYCLRASWLKLGLVT